jgi:hypothetical protein
VSSFRDSRAKSSGDGQTKLPLSCTFLFKTHWHLVGTITTTSCQCWWRCPLTKMLCLHEQAAVLPVTSTQIECSFSSMSFLKNYLRNRMAWEMNGLVICCCLLYKSSDIIASKQASWILRK